MRLTQLIFCLAVLPLSACATVDLADMTPSAKVVETPAAENDVIKTSSSLIKTFGEQGWSSVPESGRIQKAAGFLLRGMKTESAENKETYFDRVQSSRALMTDVETASVRVDQVVKAATVYLSVADEGVSLRSELKHLETALAACHRAETTFESAVVKFNEDMPNSSIGAFSDSVTQLRDVANVYGERVRARAVRPYEGAS